MRVQRRFFNRIGVSRVTYLIIGLLILTSFVLTWSLSSVPAEAVAHIYVDTFDDELNDDGDCSLREAIQTANTDTVIDECTQGDGPDIIHLPAGTYTFRYSALGSPAISLVTSMCTPII